MSDKKEDARQKAFERGRLDYGNNKFDNPYPTESPYHDYWEQGQVAERDIHDK